MCYSLQNKLLLFNCECVRRRPPAAAPIARTGTRAHTRTRIRIREKGFLKIYKLSDDSVCTVSGLL